MSDERIHVLRDILLELHHGASPESVQERFDATFAGVSAIEISLMEHELMNSDAGVTFEDVMELCDVHANLFKNAVQGVEVADQRIRLRYRKAMQNWLLQEISISAKVGSERRRDFADRSSLYGSMN